MKFPLISFTFSPFDQDLSPKAMLIKSGIPYAGVLSLRARKALSSLSRPMSEGKRVVSVGSHSGYI